MSKKLNQVLAGAALATSLGVWGSTQARGDVTFQVKDMTYGLSSGTISVTATSVTLGLYANFTGAGVLYGGLNLTRGYFGATGSADAAGNLSNAAVGNGFNVSSPATAQIGVSANLNGDNVTDWGDLPSNNSASNSNFFFVDASSHPKPANGSGTGTNATGTAVMSVLVGTIRLNMTALAGGSVSIGYGLSNAITGGGDLFAKTIWAENYTISTDVNGITGVSGTKNEIDNPTLIHFTPFKLTFAIPTWSGSGGTKDWGINGSLPESARGANWSTQQTPDGAGFPIVFANVAAGTATVSTPHTVGAITFTGSTPHNLQALSFTGTIGTATAIQTLAGAITLSRGALSSAIITSNSTVDQTLNVPMTLVSSGTIISTSGSATLHLGTVAVGTGNTLTIAAGSKVSMTNLNGVAVGGVSGRGNLDVEGSLSLVNTEDGSGNSDLTKRNSLANVSVVDSLTIGSAGILDLGNHDLIIRNGGVAMAQQVRQWLQSGFSANQDWSGTQGIKITSPINEAGITVVGYGRVADLVQNDGFNGFFDGVGVNADDVLLKYTWAGDTNLDGIVDGTDYANTDVGFGVGLPGLGVDGEGWGFGDTNYDNTVDGSDYAQVDLGFGTQNGSPLANGGWNTFSFNTVPEPTSLGLLGLGGLMLLRKRKGQK